MRDATSSALDDDILEYLLDGVAEMRVPPSLQTRMRDNILDQVAREAACLTAGFTTVRASEGEWVQAMPGALIKILHQDAVTGALAYLARLSPGFAMQGHGHPIEEECLMLEGDLWMGDLHLHAGDYHVASKGVQHGKLRTEHGALVYLKGALPV